MTRCTVAPVTWSPLDDELDDKQRAAVDAGLRSGDIALIWGPPGTGKTRTLVEVVRQRVLRGQRVLCTAPSNTAVDNLGVRLAEAGVRAVRLGHPARVSPLLAGLTIDAHANVEAAHAVTRGAGVTIAIIDDGVDIDHPEFAGDGKVVSPRDATGQTSDPRPQDNFGTGPEDGDNHGTACAGVACANGALGASGVALGDAVIAAMEALRLSDVTLTVDQLLRYMRSHGHRRLTKQRLTTVLNALELDYKVERRGQEWSLV